MAHGQRSDQGQPSTKQTSLRETPEEEERSDEAKGEVGLEFGGLDTVGLLDLDAGDRAAACHCCEVEGGGGGEGGRESE